MSESCLKCLSELDILVIPFLVSVGIAMVRLSPFGRGGALVHTMVFTKDLEAIRVDWFFCFLGFGSNLIRRPQRTGQALVGSDVLTILYSCSAYRW